MVSLSQPQVEQASAFNTLLCCCTFTAILLQCCVKVRCLSNITPNTFGFFRAGVLGRPTSLVDVGGAREYLE